MVTTYMNPRYLRQSNIANLSTLEQFQLYNEIQRVKHNLRVEATVELVKTERQRAKRSSNPNPNLGVKLDVYA